MSVDHNNSGQDKMSPDNFHDRLFELCPHTYVTWLIITVNVVLYVAAYTHEQLNFFNPDNSSDLLKWGAGNALFITHGQWWRLLTAAFVHYGIMHLLMNMICFYFVGSLIERLYGHSSFAIIYLVSAIFGNVMSLFWKGASYGGGGASGAVFGVLGAVFAACFLGRHLLSKQVVTPILRVTATIVLGSLALSFIIPRIDATAHIGGLIAGFVAGLIVPILLLSQQRSKRSVKIVLCLCIFALVGWSLWKPVMNNARRDAKCQLAINAIRRGEQYNLQAVSRLLKLPVKGQFDLFQKATKLEVLSEFWHTAGAQLDVAERPHWPLNQPHFALYHKYCQARCAILDSFAQSMRIGGSEELRDKIADNSVNLKAVQREIELLSSK